MSDEAVSQDREARRADRQGEPARAPSAEPDALEALRDIVFGKRLEQVEDLRRRVEDLRTLLQGLEGRAERADERAAEELAGRIAALDGLGARIDAIADDARRAESDAQRALAERAASVEALARRVDAAEALAERIEGAGGLGERVEHVERLRERVDDVERLAQRVDDLDRLDDRLRAVEVVRERVVDEELRAEDVSIILPRAVAARARRDGQLAASLRPTIEDTLEASVRRNPQALVDIIFPVLGPAIRKMIGSAITSMVGSINRAVESSFTVRGLKWRMQAWRTKRSYAEIALMHGLVYRVEQLFLIQRNSGLLLAHAVRDPTDAEEPETISGMLTAVTDFVRDSFKVESGSEVETFRVGDLTLVVKGGPKAVLAATVRGVPPPELHDRLSTTIEQVHSEYGQVIDAFDGDASELAGVEGLLEPNLLEEAKEARKRRGPASIVFWVLLAVVAATLVANVVVTNMRAARVERDVRALARTLAAEPGIAITGVHADGDAWVIEGLRDPLAAGTSTHLEKSGLDPRDVELRIAAYRSLEPAFVQRRVAARLLVPATVALAWRDRTLVLTGRCSGGWLASARRLALDADGVDRIDVSGLAVDPVLDALDKVSSTLNEWVYSADPRTDADKLDALRGILNTAREAAGTRYAVRLVVLGLARRPEDAPGARARLDQLIGRLRTAGIEGSRRFLGPAELAQPAPGQLLPTGTDPEIRFDLEVRRGEGGR